MVVQVKLPLILYLAWLLILKIHKWYLNETIGLGVTVVIGIDGYAGGGRGTAADMLLRKALLKVSFADLEGCSTLYRP